MSLCHYHLLLLCHYVCLCLCRPAVLHAWQDPTSCPTQTYLLHSTLYTLKYIMVLHYTSLHFRFRFRFRLMEVTGRHVGFVSPCWLTYLLTYLYQLPLPWTWVPGARGVDESWGRRNSPASSEALSSSTVHHEHHPHHPQRNNPDKRPPSMDSASSSSLHPHHPHHHRHPPLSIILIIHSRTQTKDLLVWICLHRHPH